MAKKLNPKTVYEALEERYGVPTPPLDHETPEQLAVAVILSAQCTDERVNQVTPALFKAYPDMASLEQATQEDVEKLIYSTGFYRNKAKSLLGLAKELNEKYAGKIPRDFAVLCKLPGIGRKTANVIMNQVFGEAPGVVVDTHVMRLSKRFLWTSKSNAVQVEKDLMALLPKKMWKDISLYLIFFGREFCSARAPQCEICQFQKKCPSFQQHSREPFDKKQGQ